MNQVDLNLKKYEIEPNWVTFYFDEVSSNAHPMAATHLFELCAHCCCINSSFRVVYHALYNSVFEKFSIGDRIMYVYLRLCFYIKLTFYYCY